MSIKRHVVPAAGAAFNKLMVDSLRTLLFVGALGVAENATAANLLVNGSFESPVQTAPNFATFNIPQGSTLITGWTVVQGNVDLTFGADYTPSHDGAQDVDLIGDSNGSNGVFGGLAQTFSTATGQKYELDFAYTHNNGTFSANGYAAHVTVVDANDTSDQELAVDVSQVFNQQGYDLFSQTFIADSSSTTLTFIDTRGGVNAGIYLDGVSVEAVNSGTPEPSAWAMLILGFAGVGAATRHRGRRARAFTTA
jgi:hypothetical protein